MAKDPAFLFYYQDFLVGTEFMTAEEVGLYIRILCHLADKGKLSERHILSICKGYAFTENIKEKLLIDENGYFYQKRLRDEVEKRKLYSESRRKNAKAYAKHMPKHMENENENENENINENNIINVPFENFWDYYDKKIDRPKCEKKWLNLKDKDRVAIMNYIPKYKLSKPDKKFRRDPATFLNNRTWENELIYEESEKNTRPKSYQQWLDGRPHNKEKQEQYQEYLKQFDEYLIPGLEKIGKEK